MGKSTLGEYSKRCRYIFVHQTNTTHLCDAKVSRNSEIYKDNWSFNTSTVKLKFTRTKKAENVSIEHDRVTEIRKETQ